MRMDPPPSPAEASGTMPAAAAAAEPPLEPPGVRCRFHGLRLGPCSSGSVTPRIPNSGQLVLPMSARPACRYRATSSLSASGIQSCSARLP